MDKGQRKNKLLTPQENEPSDSGFLHQKLEGLDFPVRWKVSVLIRPSELLGEI